MQDLKLPLLPKCIPSSVTQQRAKFITAIPEGIHLLLKVIEANSNSSSHELLNPETFSVLPSSTLYSTWMNV